MSTRDLRAQSGRPTYTSFPAYASTVESRARGSDPNADTDSYPHHRRRRRRRRGRNGSPPEDSFLEHDDSSSSDSDETIRAVGGPRPVAEEEIHRRAPERGERAVGDGHDGRDAGRRDGTDEDDAYRDRTEWNARLRRYSGVYLDGRRRSFDTDGEVGVGDGGSLERHGDGNARGFSAFSDVDGGEPTTSPGGRARDGDCDGGGGYPPRSTPRDGGARAVPARQSGYENDEEDETRSGSQSYEQRVRRM